MPKQLGANRSCRPLPDGVNTIFLAETGKIIKLRIAQISGGQPFGVSGTANRTTLLATESFSAAHITLRFAFMMTLAT